MQASSFDEHAGEYDTWFTKNQNVLTSEVLLIRRALGEPGRVLSVGCGSGLFELLLRRDHGIEIGEGIEPAEGMARIARHRGLRVKAGSAESIPHEDARFDTVLMNGTPAYLEDLGRAFGEAFRVLRRKGHVVIGDVPASSAYGILYQYAGLLGSWDDPRLAEIAPRDPYPVEFLREAHWHTTEEVAAVLGAVGFEDLQYWQTLTTHVRFSNDRIEEPIGGYERGGYVAIRARKP
jgi:ubiquinone/menaquinone biosynthesis C-methylase UbiE